MLSKTMRKKLTKHFYFRDLDQDGFVEREDWEQCARNLAEQAFSRLDLNSDGRVSRGAFIQFGSNFHISDEPDVPGNWLFGPYD